MGYYHGEKSLGLGPILITLSLVAVMGFGVMYYAYGRSVDTTATGAQALPPESAQPVVPAPPPSLAAKGHNHV
ncbi:MAG TPA: hypothetical protein V6C69_20910 [Trichormus sp.]|jgi:hypothetical protein